MRICLSLPLLFVVLSLLDVLPLVFLMTYDLYCDPCFWTEHPSVQFCNNCSLSVVFCTWAFNHHTLHSRFCPNTIWTKVIFVTCVLDLLFSVTRRLFWPYMCVGMETGTVNWRFYHHNQPSLCHPCKQVLGSCRISLAWICISCFFFFWSYHKSNSRDKDEQELVFVKHKTASPLRSHCILSEN